MYITSGTGCRIVQSSRPKLGWVWGGWRVLDLQPIILEVGSKGLVRKLPLRRSCSNCSSSSPKVSLQYKRLRALSPASAEKGKRKVRCHIAIDRAVGQNNPGPDPTLHFSATAIQTTKVNCHDNIILCAPVFPTTHLFCCCTHRFDKSKG